SRSVGQPPPSASEAAGAGDGTRTHNRSLTRRLLCPLSYPSPPPHGPGARLRPWHWHRHRHRHGHGHRHRTAGAAAPATGTAIATDTDTDTGTDTATAIVTDTATATSTAITTDTDNAADNAAAAAGKPHADAGRTPSIVAARGFRVQVYDDAGQCTMRSLRRFPADRVDIAQAELMDGPHQRTVLRERPQRQNGFDSVGDVADAELVRGNFNIMDAVPHAQARLDVVAAQLLDEVPPAFVQLGVVFKML